MAIGKTKIGQPVAQLPVEDVEKAQIYYNEILGFEILWTYPDKSIGAVWQENATIFFATTNGPISPNIHWIFAENIDLTYAELKDSSAEIIEAIENKPWNMRQFAIRDLNGHVFYIHHDL
ncbi:VOC family protein [Mucilaginibacter sp.]|uniref:VOC family protein n=1 Tax=Mucilaginibacter sp. TaxID=1882438 RepID=UPI00285171A1|nr:VOC family protein [Mucilaginibacter sp.]MDR3694598.1 VOC family protein [Mucilaginibacter sp.]